MTAEKEMMVTMDKLTELQKQIDLDNKKLVSALNKNKAQEKAYNEKVAELSEQINLLKTKVSQLKLTNEVENIEFEAVQEQLAAEKKKVETLKRILEN